MSNIEQLQREGLADRLTWNFGSETLPLAPDGWAAQVLADMAEVDAEEAAQEAAEWDAYADALTDAYYAGMAAADPKLNAMHAALAMLESAGVKAALDARIDRRSGWMVL